MKARLATLLRRTARKLDGKLFVEITPPASATALDDGEFVTQITNKIELNRALHAALHRYSPAELPAQA